MSRADDFDGKNAAAHNSSTIYFSEHLKVSTRSSMYDQRNRISLTTALYDLVHRSYKCIKKKCNATYETP
jgi:hypothetical protein